MSHKPQIEFDYFPYGNPCAENIDQYIAFFEGLPLERQYVWGTKLVDRSSSEQTPGKFYKKLTKVPGFGRIMRNITTGTFPGELTCVNLTIGTHWHRVTYTAIVNKDDTEDSIKELGYWIAKNHYSKRAKFIDESSVTVRIERSKHLSDDLATHVAEQGYEVGFYENFKTYQTTEDDNEFFPMSTRQAMIDNFLATEAGTSEADA